MKRRQHTRFRLLENLDIKRSFVMAVQIPLYTLSFRRFGAFLKGKSLISMYLAEVDNLAGC